MEEKKKTIVVVDDEEDIRSALKEVLSETYKVYEAADGAEACRLIKRIMPDAVLLDILMPEKDGYEVCKELKKDKLTTRIPIVFLSAKAQISDAEKGYNVGGDAYVAKPFSAEKLLLKIEAVLEKADIRQSMLDDDRKRLSDNS